MMPSLIQRAGTTWLWLALLALFVVLAMAWAADPLGWADEVQPAQRPVAQSSEWTTAPEGPRVPVDLPDVPVKAVPATSGTMG